MKRRFGYVLAVAALAALAGMASHASLRPRGIEAAPPGKAPPGKAPPGQAPPGQAPPGQAPGAAEVEGLSVFRQAAAYIANGGQPITEVKDFYTELDDVIMDVEGSHHEGHLRLWFAKPDKYRYESRTRRTATDATIKMLDGNKLWVVTASGTKAMHKSAEGVGAIRQARKDRDRIGHLSKFLTLGGLIVPNVKFHFAGPKLIATGPFRGDWLQVDRVVGHASKISGPKDSGSKISFFFHYRKDAAGGVALVGAPGVVTLWGDPAKATATEHFILSKWRAGPTFRYPSTISALSDADGVQKRFLLAQVQDIRINTSIDARYFRPRGR